MKFSLVIPAYNEAEGVSQTAQKLRPVLDQLRKANDLEVVFVNDGSKDDTEALLKQEFDADPGVKVVSHDRNRGLGAAIRTGFSHVNGDMIVTTDFDGTYSFDTISQLLALMVDGVDIVTASPYHPQGHVDGVPPYRLVFSYGASLLYRILVKWNIYCWTALFRAYRQPVIKTISFESNDFLAGTELLVNALRAGYKVVEYPTTLRVRTFGQSSLKIARVTKTHLQFQFAILKARLTGNKSGPVRRLSS